MSRRLFPKIGGIGRVRENEKYEINPAPKKIESV